MKIMRGDSRAGAFACRLCWTTIVQGMTHPTLHRPVQRYLAISIHRRFLMQWTTPQALDFRFGFEITMYVAAR